jgi:hypothetical protein
MSVYGKRCLENCLVVSYDIKIPSPQLALLNTNFTKHFGSEPSRKNAQWLTHL